jgi:hypothetical protein
MSLNYFSSDTNKKEWMKINCGSVKVTNLDVQENFIVGDGNYRLPTEGAEENQILRVSDASGNVEFTDDLTNLENELEQVKTDYLKRDGTLNMTGNLNLDGNNILNITDATVNGTLTVNGTTISNLNVENNFILVNDGETGAGVSAGTAGLEVDRGTETNYKMQFNESSGLFEVGEIGSEVPLACIENAPQDTGYTYYDNASACLKTQLQIPANRLGSGNVDDTELSYLDGVTSGIQSQLDGKVSNTIFTSHTTATTAHGTSSSIVGESDSQTLTNKTIDAANNTISNIGNTQIISGVDATKIGNGDVDNTELSRLNGIQSQAVGQNDTITLANKTIDANSNNLVDVCRLSQTQTLTGVKTFSNGLNISSNFLTFTNLGADTNRIVIPAGNAAAFRLKDTTPVSYLTIDTLNQEVKMNQDLNVNGAELKNVYTSRANAYRAIETGLQTTIGSTQPKLLNTGTLTLSNTVDFTQNAGVLTYTGATTKWFRVEYHASLTHQAIGNVKVLKMFLALDPNGAKTEQVQSYSKIATEYDAQFTGYCELQLSQNDEIGLCIQNQTDSTNLISYNVSLSVKQLHQ